MWSSGCEVDVIPQELNGETKGSLSSAILPGDIVQLVSFEVCLLHVIVYLICISMSLPYTMMVFIAH